MEADAMPRITFTRKRGLEKREGVLHAEGTDDSARLVLISNEPVNIELDMLSLFPQATFYDRKMGCD